MVYRIVACDCYRLSGTMLVSKHADTSTTHCILTNLHKHKAPFQVKGRYMAQAKTSAHIYTANFNSTLCRWYEAREETSAHVLCECEALASRRHAYLGSFPEPGDIKNLNLGAI